MKILLVTPMDLFRRLSDEQADEYVSRIFGARNYMVVDHINRLPEKLPGLYLCGGSAHPGAGVPMVARSGMLAAESVLSDLASTARSFRAATPGGMLTR